jgi:hypothetical protein
MRLLLLLCTLLPLVSQPGYAQCDCLWRGSFNEVQAQADLVVSGTVVARIGNSIDLAVARPLRGPEPPETIRVWLQAADYCRPEAELFPVATEWVMALDKITDDVPGGFNPNTPNISYGRLGDYTLSSCGGYWLRLKDDRVTGNLINAPRWEREPKMTPVLLDLVEDYVQGRLDRDALLQASREDPALRELILDTRSFLRNENQ